MRRIFYITYIFFNTSNCDCKCDKSCNIGEYLDYLNCKCRKKLIDPTIEECNENINETKPSENEHKKSAGLV